MFGTKRLRNDLRKYEYSERHQGRRDSLEPTRIVRVSDQARDFFADSDGSNRMGDRVQCQNRRQRPINSRLEFFPPISYRWMGQFHGRDERLTDAQ